MKKFNVLTKVAMAVALVCGVAACEPDVPEEVAVPVIELSATEASILSEGGMVNIVYAIENPVEGQSIKGTSDATWLVVNTSMARKIMLVAEKNDTGAQRTAKVTISYEGAESKEITVTQDAYVVPISLTVSAIEATKVTFSVSTAEPTLTWTGQIVGKEWYDDLGGDEDKIFEQDYDYYMSEAQFADITLEAFLATILNEGSKENLTFSGLDPESEYVIYVYGLNLAGERTTPLYAVPITTEAPWDGPLTFELDAYAEGHIIHASCKVSHEGSNYWFDIVPASYIEDDASKLMEYAQGQIDWKIQDWKDHDYIYDDSEFFDFFNHTLNIGGYTMEGTANSKYYVYACKWGKDCKLVGDIAYCTVVTEDVKPSDNKFTLEITNVTATTCEFTLQTTNDDQYFIAPVPAWYFEDMAGQTDADYFDAIYHDWAGCVDENDFNMIYYTDYGSIRGTFTALDPETEHILCLFGYTAGTMTTEMTRIEFTTLPAGDPKDCTFTIEVPAEDIKIREIHAIISPSDDSVRFFFDVFAADATTADVIAHIDNIKANLWEPMEFNRYVSYLEQDVDISGLSPNTNYKIGVIAMEEGYIFDNYGDPIGRGYTVAAGCEAVFSEVFTTKEAKVADVTIECGFYDGYYDGKVLSDAKPNSYGAWYEYAYVPMSAKVDGEYDYYRYSMFAYQDGLEDPEQYSDELIIQNLERVGVNYSPAFFRGQWDVPQMLAAVAVDNDGNYSAVFRKVVTFTHDGVSPAENILGSGSESVQALNNQRVAPLKIDAQFELNNTLEGKVINSDELRVEMNKNTVRQRAAKRQEIANTLAEKRNNGGVVTTKRYYMDVE